MTQRLSLVVWIAGGALALFACACGTTVVPRDGGGLCPDGAICVDGNVPDAGRPDGGPDGGPAACEQPATPGTSGARCRMGTTCETGLTCAQEISRFPMTGQPLTLENTFAAAIYTATGPDPGPDGTVGTDDDPEGEYLVAADPASGTDIPLAFGPGGQCSAACTLPTQAMPMPPNTCGSCASCSATLGGSESFGALGISVRSFVDLNGDNMGDPICRQNCTWEPDSRGGCPMGYTCDPTENICVEACTVDAQCQLGFGLNRRYGTVAVLDGSATCNTATGQCEWTAPTGAAAGSTCENNEDCPAGLGRCLIGNLCVQYGCGIVDPADPGGMAPLYPCPTGTICLGFGGAPGNVAGACIMGCNSASDCPAGNACSPLSGTVGGFTGYCIGICENDGECHADERCNKGGFSSPDIGVCQSFCTPAGQTPMTGAQACAADEFCLQEGTSAIGYCVARDALCVHDDDCFDGQACEVVGNDFYGRCVDGCGDDGDCPGTGAECVRQRYCVDAMGETTGTCTISGSCGTGLTCQPAQARGVCRAPGGQCSPPVAAFDDLLFLRGDAQCLDSQSCNATMPDMVGACADCGLTAGAACCRGTTCPGANLVCSTATTTPSCVACGASGERCCAGDACNT
ncbi:MAG: hypothetical protein K8H88_00080, partial [Sandaracinaceae bacterium]|nr:hypothetical protein [Sandaracinaceae bacterium]